MRVDEDGELEMSIAYGDGSSVRTVFLTPEAVGELAALISDTPEPAEDEQPIAEFYADRADAWHSAHGLLIGKGMAFDTSPEDVLQLAKFLAGDDIA
ncbi:hypothetical protein [Streptomyces katsurahamanus]|uniref:Uncharacterized protein n=1 Tax=Streptomyces katsurahamanus TaxID=2577098 RepID=A0ABW9P3H4_9ACTN|nr:hypothetical protein [Streptomyces katsurahamanus]MQS40018.1 hypothetical protein [Streptomyces katsurahamanus]